MHPIINKQFKAILIFLVILIFLNNGINTPTKPIIPVLWKKQADRTANTYLKYFFSSISVYEYHTRTIANDCRSPLKKWGYTRK